MPKLNGKVMAIEVVLASLLALPISLGITKLVMMGYKPAPFPMPFVFAVIGAGFVSLSRMDYRWWNYVYGVLGTLLFAPLMAAMGVGSGGLIIDISAVVSVIIALSDSLENGQKMAPVLRSFTLVPLILISMFWP